MTDATPSSPRGRLAHVLETRTGKHGDLLRLENREALVYALGKAAELEHLIMLQYLYTVFSMKSGAADGLDEEQAAAVQRWRRTLTEISEQEMLHLALVQNLLTAVGGAPRLARPNYPVAPYHYPAGVQVRLVPFNETSIRHFAFLERPMGMAFDDAEGFEALGQAVELPRDEADEIAPQLQDFDTLGLLYRSIEAGFDHLAQKLGPERLFVGQPNAQATEAHFRWPELVAVRDVATAHQAIDTIVEQGEGARGEWRDAHFGKLYGILEELIAFKAADPTFEPARPVVAAAVRGTTHGPSVAVISDPGTARAMDLLNVSVEVLLQLLSRYFAHTDETEEQLGVLADIAVGLMYGAIKPLGNVITKLPIGFEYPDVTAGPTFELFYEVDYLLPHREAAWVVMEERLREAAGFARRCTSACTPIVMGPLARTAQALEKFADMLAAAGGSRS